MWSTKAATTAEAAAAAAAAVLLHLKATIKCNN
jgi:hypothetical protein